MSDVTARPEFRGSFIQGGWGTVYIRICDLKGFARNVDTISISIAPKGSATPILTETPERIDRGLYVYDWPIPANQPAGPYSVTWTYSSAGKEYTETHEVVVAIDAYGNAHHSIINALLRVKMEQMLPAFQSRPIQSLQADPTEDFVNYSFNFQRWNQSAGVRVYRNNNLLTSGYEVDYLNGRVIFNQKLTEYDTILASYNFRLFADDDLDLFLNTGLQIFNIQNPHSDYSLSSIPEKFVPAVIHGAIVEAMRVHMQQMIWPEYRVLHQDPARADKAFDEIDKVKQSHEELCKMMYEQKSKFGYVGLTRTIQQPQYAIPGGRARFFRYLFGNGF